MTSCKRAYCHLELSQQQTQPTSGVAIGTELEPFVRRQALSSTPATPTGNPGSVILPQYVSSKITVFVWGKNTILKFVGNTKYKSMKLTVQLVVVVLIAPTKFRDNLFKFTLYTIIIYKVGDKRCHLHRHVSIQHNFFHEIRTPIENKHARIGEIG